MCSNRQFFFILFSCCGVAFGASYCRAQGTYLGIAPGVNFVNYKTAPFSIPNSDPGIKLQNGSGTAPLVGVSLEIGLEDYNTDFLLAEVYYDSKSARFASSINNMSASISYFLLNIGYKYH